MTRGDGTGHGRQPAAGARAPSAPGWTRPADLRAQVQRWWARGEILASLVRGETLFPRRLALKGPSSAELAEQFDRVRDWIAELRATPHCRVELREVRHRVLGTNAVPHEVWVDTLEDALALAGRTREAARFTTLIQTTRARQPALLDWLARRPLQALALADEWDRLLAIVDWVARHPRPGVYLRQVDLPGVHTKLLEAHRGVLAELLDRVLPASAVDATATGVGQFARRYGFRERPVRVRFRLLDPVRGDPDRDMTLDADSFTCLAPGVSRAFITENEVSFLAFPPVPESVIVFGAGYGFEMLGRAAWLSRCRIHYWGDIDTHGFAILDQLRAQFPHAASFLMDRATLLACESMWGEEEKQTLRDLPRLDGDERALYDDLRDNRIRPRLRLEQERIGFGRVQAALTTLPALPAR